VREEGRKTDEDQEHAVGDTEVAQLDVQCSASAGRESRLGDHEQQPPDEYCGVNMNHPQRF
jgi:hypothetical protein